ncbi:MAG: hypothetical protein D6722_20540 [Bacteroidetes bacterium]|nr:MAG: hypothetical protein D6722_20540 [Bacteroidota bacterium]
MGGLGLLILVACQETIEPQLVELEALPTTSQAFEPAQEVALEQGMLVFQSQEDLLLTLHQIAQAGREAVDRWETQMDFVSQQYLFNQVVRAYDSIDAHYFSLPEDEQAYWRQQPEVHPAIYFQGLEEGWLKLQEDPDGSSYFQYAVCDPSMAAVLNREGLVKIGDEIYQYRSQTLKVLLTGEFEKIPLLDRVNRTVEGEVLVYDFAAEMTRSLTSNFTSSNVMSSEGWRDGGSRKRYRLWVDGSSSPATTPVGFDCVSGMSCTFQVRSEAQKKNFWGTWQYKGDYGYSLSIGDARGPAAWTYAYEMHNNGGLCGLTNACILGPLVGAYNCPVAPCPTSPYTAFYPWTNNGFFRLTPDGSWTLSNNYFCSAFEVDYLIYATYNQQYTLTP